MIWIDDGEEVMTLLQHIVRQNMASRVLSVSIIAVSAYSRFKAASAGREMKAVRCDHFAQLA
jgi:hypothetical protein